jgi:hypothetical protein
MASRSDNPSKSAKTDELAKHIAKEEQRLDLLKLKLDLSAGRLQHGKLADEKQKARERVFHLQNEFTEHETALKTSIAELKATTNEMSRKQREQQKIFTDIAAWKAESLRVTAGRTELQELRTMEAQAHVIRELMLELQSRKMSLQMS